MTDDAGVATRRTAIDALVRIETDRAYANLATNAILDRSPLEQRDRHFVTELVYGTCRMTRACDHLIDRHRRGDVSARVQAALRLGTYQLAFAGVAPHASVDATVGASPRPARGLVNAVLRRIARDVQDGITWPSDGVQLSYPDWVVRSYQEFLGVEQAQRSLAAMNEPATTHTRLDGYVQDLASQEVVDAVGASAGERVLDLCAAPGGKATGLAARGADVIAADVSPGRLSLVVDNAEKLGARLPVVAADAVHPPFAPETFDRVLVDAPCSGLGVLRRRPDARWRIDAGAPDRLAALQVDIVDAAARLVAPGGLLVYSVCTLTAAETDGVVGAVELPADFEFGDRTVIAPDAQRDGMFLATWRRR